MTPWIVAISARTPVGVYAESTAAAIRAGISRLRAHPFLVDAMGEPLSCGWDSRLDPDLDGVPRMAALARASFDELVSKLSPTMVPAQTPLILVLPERRPGLDTEDEAELLTEIRSFTGTFRLELGPRGHAGGVAAIQRAQELLALGVPLVVILAVDSYLDPDTTRWLDAAGRLPGSVVRGAFPPGEAAAALALAGDPMQPGTDPGSTAFVRGIGVATERRSRDSDEGLLGEGLTQALRAAVADLRLPDEAVDDLYGDINGERHRTDDWVFSMLRFPRVARRATDFRLSVDCIGDVGAATGPLACVLAVRAWARGYASGPRALIWAGSDSGLRAAVVLQRRDA